MTDDGATVVGSPARAGRRRRAAAALRDLGPAGWVLVVVMVVLDVALVGANLLFHTVDEPGREPVHPVWSDLRWNGDNDGSWMEHAGQVQLAGAVVGMLVLWRRTREHLYVALAALLAWVVVDDLARVHEAGGELAVRLQVPAVAGIPAQQLGELAVWGVSGLAIGLAVLVGYRAASARGRTHARAVLVLFVVLLVFALGIDTVRPVLDGVASSWLETGLSLAESAGELGALTLLTIAVLVMVRTTPAGPAAA